MFISSDLRFYIISLGCSKNQVDSERINGSMISAGFKQAESSEEADIIIVNTCGFINDAKKESIEVIFSTITQIDENKGQERLRIFSGKHGPIPARFIPRIVVTGCLTKRYFDDIKKDIPEIDFIYGIPDEKFVKEIADDFNIKIDTYDQNREFLYEKYPYSYIKISDGCSNNCSYCAIPLIRGPIRSFSPEFIMDESKNAVAAGAVELNIIAQDIAAYSHSGKGLVDIVNDISVIEGVEWIRLLYCHPDHLTEDIFNLIGNNAKVVPYIDIPFQHINERILRSMGRMGNYEVYSELVSKIRELVPGIVLRSTFMVGYPGETEEEFEELVSFIETAKIDKVGCFTYSPEEDTKSFELDDNVDSETKIERYNRLMSIQRDISQEKLGTMIGSQVDILVEEKVDDNTYIGRTKYDAPEVDGVFYLTSTENRLNSIVKAVVTDAVEYDLIGELV